jgi:YVTN family beta-propeller protein
MNRTSALAWISFSLLAVSLPGYGDTAATPTTQKLYVAGTSSDEVYVIDVATQKLLKTLHLGKGSFPHGFAAPDGGRILWIAAEDHGSIVKLDTQKDEVLATYKLGREVHELEITADGRLLYAPMFNDHCYFVFDTEKAQVIAKLPVNGTPHNVVRAGGDSRYMYLSPMHSTVETMKRSSERKGHAYLDCDGKPKDPVPGDRIYVADTTTNTIVGEIITGTAPRPIAASHDGSRLYADIDNLLGFLVIDTRERKVLERVKFPLETEAQKTSYSRSHGIWVTPDQKQVWATSVNHDLVYAYDRTVEPVRFLAAIPVGGAPYWITFSTDNKYGYISNGPQGELAVIDTSTHKVLSHIKLPDGAHPKTTLVVDVPNEG